MPAYNVIDAYEKDLLDQLREVQAQIQVLRRRLVDGNDVKAIDTDVGAAGGSVVKGSQRMILLMKERDNILKQLAALPYEAYVPVALGTDTLGRDIGEYALS